MRYALYFHLLSLLVLAAGGIGGKVMHLALAKDATSSRDNIMTFGKLSQRFGMTAGMGGILMLISGLTLAGTRGWGDFGHTWLSIKLAIYVVLMFNGLVIARKTGEAIVAAVQRSPTDPALPGLVRRLGIFHSVQLVGFVAIITLAVFGP